VSVAARIVVVGAGLAGHECVRRLLADPSFDGEITWFGAEPDRPYNRILLTDLLAGHHALDAIGLPALTDQRLTLRQGRSVSSIDLAAGTVRDHHDVIPFDRLILATGADPALPPVRGNAVPLRTLSDARTILSALDSGVRKIAVLGGGPLGVQAACALLAQKRSVDIVHRGGHLMNRWLDREAGDLLAGSLREAGISVHCGKAASAVTGGLWPKADLVVVACGTNPRVALAKSAGLPVEHGIVVDDHGCSLGDPRVFAVGDCAQTPTGVHGLALAALDQARRAADSILHSRSPTPAVPTLLRLRAHGVPGADTAVLSAAASHSAPPAVRLVDQHRRTHKALTLATDTTRIESATLVGDVSAAAAVSRLLAWPSPQPEDPAALLITTRSP
jgi:assimilatory nitrate reductase electron transfer subunit